MSIDTSVFITCGFSNFEKRPVQSLKFYSKMLAIVTPKIIFHEIANHYAKDFLDKNFSKAKNFLEYIADVEEFSQDAKNLLQFNSKQFCRKKVQDFFEHECEGVIYWPQSGIDMLDIYEDYVDINPPFEKCENKKCEFPDAVALRALEAHAKTNKTNIFVMSDDSGWYKFAEISQLLFMIDKDTLIQKGENHNYAILINNLKAIKEFDSKNTTIIEFMKVCQPVRQAIEEKISEFTADPSNFLATVHTAILCTEEVIGAKIKEICFPKMDVDILEKEDENYSFMCYIETELHVRVDVETYYYENIDKNGDKTGIHKYTIPIEHEFMITVEANISLSENGLDPEIEILETEIVSGDVLFDFEMGNPWHAPLTPTPLIP